MPIEIKDSSRKILHVHEDYSFIEGVFNRLVLRDAQLQNSDCRYADFSWSTLDCIKFTGSKLSHVNFGNTTIVDGCLNECDLTGAYFSQSDLRFIHCKGSLMKEVDLEDCNLYGANLIGVDLSGSTLDGANLKCAKLNGAILDGCTFYNAIGNGKEIKTLIVENLVINNILGKMLQVGDKLYTREKWLSFSDEEIKDYLEIPLKFWVKYKPALIAMGWL